MVVNTRPATPTRRPGGIHCVYALEIPVARHDAAHGLPLAYLSHIADRLSHHLGADPGYIGLLTRNPINPGPECFTDDGVPLVRSIPAWAGEPLRVYPRVGSWFF